MSCSGWLHPQADQADTASTSEEADMAAGDGLEGTLSEFTADEFWGSDRAGQKVAIEGCITEGNLSADKITLQ